jgi:hypothetical protein
MLDRLPRSRAADKWLAGAIFPVHEQWLVMCRQCRWWCLRECLEDAETAGSVDYFTVGVRQSATDTAGHTHDKPWLRALDDESLYDRVEALPEGMAALFPGGEKHL